jgi:CDP-diacylglycerol--glycerol-3-phosphate 3-phosphatidyltransferase
MARLSGTTSVLGGFLDSVLDRITDAALVGSLLWWSIAHDSESWIVVSGIVALASSEVIPYVRAKAESLSIECKVGIMERSERALIVGLAALLAGFGYTSVIGYALGALAVLNCITIVQRIAVVAQSLKVSGLK